MKKILNFCIVFVLAFLVFAGCYFRETKKFNKADWNDLSGGYFNKRGPMLEDLLTNHQLKGKNIGQLRKLFGQKDLGVYEYDHQLIIYMNIITDFGWNIDPQYTKDLYLYLNKDSVVTSFKVKEYHSK